MTKEMAGKDVELISGSLIEDANTTEMAADIDVHEETNDIEKGSPTQFGWPFLNLLSEESRALYFSRCVPLVNAVINGDIEEARRLLRMKYQYSVLCTAITKSYETILHVAAGAGQIRFVQEIVKLMEPEELMLQDINGNTAFCFAAMIGSLQIAKIMLEKNANLLTVRGGKNMTPLYLTALFGQRNMAKFLYPLTKQNLTEDDRKAIFLISIRNGLYGLALTMLEDDKELALARHVQYGTALHMLAQRPSAFDSRSPGLYKRLTKFFPGMKLADQDTDLISTQALKLVKHLWKEIIQRQDEDAMELIRNPSNLLFDAAESGNYELLTKLIKSYLDLVHELDEHDRTIFHVAVLHDHNNILNLIDEIGFAKELLMTYVDKDQNSILHLAAKYHHPNLMTTESGAALQMQQELLKFKEVEKIVKPSFKEMKNSEGRTPRELFTIEHAEIMKSAELSTKKTASLCVIIASLVTVVMFAAAFSVPGGKNDETGIPVREILYQVFHVANAIALFCSSISMLTLFHILTLCCAEEDFLKWLPLQLMTGLSALSMSIITMLIAFSSVFLIYYHHRLNWVPVLTILIACVATTLIVLPRHSTPKA